MPFTVVIPARYGSSRLPGKPLLDIAGKPMIQRVWEQACLSDASQVVVATDDLRIQDACARFGAQVCMTAATHPSGTDRLQEVVHKLELPADHIVVNVQGDEPLIPPAVINQVALNLSGNTQAEMATLCEPIIKLEDLHNPNIVKVVFSEDGLALYFSRAAIPFSREPVPESEMAALPEGTWNRHIGIYGYRCGFLHRFVLWSAAPLEKREQLEQLRALYHGVKIHVERVVENVPPGVDTQQDIDFVRALFQ